jgi:molybdopterin molybdotransferase
MVRGLIELDEARRLVLESARALGGEGVPLAGAFERVLAEDVVATDAVPAFDNSAMDGFALRARDLRGADHSSPASLRVVGCSRAGHPGAASVGPGQAVAVSTGAMMPSGADAVMPLEETDADVGTVAVFEQTRPGAFVRRAGDDINAGQTVLTRGTRVGPAELGVLAEVGRESVLCSRRPRVSVLTTGDELVVPGEALRAGAVRDSSAHSIPALARQAGGEVVHVASAPDQPRAIEAAIADALAGDVVIVCGGASVGEHDYVKRALAALEVRQHFWGIALKPGKPTWFGVRGETLVFGLPGNPVSSMVTFILLVRPALLALTGAAPEPLRTTARLACDYEKSPGRAHAVRCRLRTTERGFEVKPTGPQGSHVLTSMVGAQALAIIPAASGPVSAGARVQIELLGPLAAGTP